VDFLAIFSIVLLIVSLEPIESSPLGGVESHHVDTVFRLLYLGKCHIAFENHFRAFNYLPGGSVLKFKVIVALFLFNYNQPLASVSSALVCRYIVSHDSGFHFDCSLRSCATCTSADLRQESLELLGVHVVHICFSFELTN